MLTQKQKEIALRLADQYWASKLGSEVYFGLGEDELFALLERLMSSSAMLAAAPQPAEGVVRDAERYRYVRESPAMLLHLSNKDFDAAIDAAMAKEKA